MDATRILICDDEAPARARLRRLVDELADCEVVGEAARGEDALRLCAAVRPDVLLLDIRMPGMDGIETARHVAGLEPAPAVIFTTAYDNYAVEAFDAQAVGYVLKPVRRERLARALASAARLTRGQVRTLGGGNPPVRSSLCVRRSAGLYLIPVERIRCFEADQKYVTVHHADGEDLIDEPLKDLAAEFADRFLRIHRSILVAADHLDRMERGAAGQYEVFLRGSAQPLPVSRRHVTDVKLALRRRAR